MIVGKKHEGLLVVFAGSVIDVRGIGFGARDVKVFSTSEISVEPVTMVLDGADVPGVRIDDGRGKPMFAAAVVLPVGQREPTVQQDLRDEVCAVLAG